MTRRALGTTAIDVAASVLVGLACVAEQFTGDVGGPSAWSVVVAVLFAGPLLMRRTASLKAAAMYTAFVGLHLLVDNRPEHGGGPWLAGLFLGYAAGRFGRHRSGLAELAVLVGATMLLWGLNHETVPTDFFFPEFFVTVAWAAGRAVRYDVRLAARVHEEAARVLERAEDERRRVQAAERRRIAREMHDVIAHSVSVMVVQAGGARRILATDAARAEEAARLIEQTGRDALTELRTLLGVIGAEPERSGAPAPSLTRLGELVERARDAGLDPRLTTTGDLADLPTGLDVAAYRIVQEALTNALRHAGQVRTEIALRRDAAALSIEVVNAPPAQLRDPSELTRPGGHGLLGMAERATLYGGDLDASPTPDGGFRVATSLTLHDHEMENAA
ncbi:MAG: histidine kinase [Patulibacter sp.]|nr:histidine kinase [Patulibacter sp.]